MNVNEIVSAINKLSQEDKQILYTRSFGFGYISGDLNDKLELISLVALISNKVKANNENATTLKILQQATNIKNGNEYDFLVNLSIIVDDFSYETTKFDSMGYNTAQELYARINVLIKQWLPF